VRRDLRDTSDFRDQQRLGAAAANGHAPLATSEPQPGGIGDPDVSDQASLVWQHLLENSLLCMHEPVMTMLPVTW